MGKREATLGKGDNNVVDRDKTQATRDETPRLKRRTPARQLALGSREFRTSIPPPASDLYR